MTITIVTAFCDLGRDRWPVFGRKTDIYLQRFRWLCELNNRIIVYADPSIKDQIIEIQKSIKPDLIIVFMNVLESHATLLAKISSIQQRADFQAGIASPSCPEYWNPGYVLINNLISAFCDHAISEFDIRDSHVAWIDFGYVRDPALLPQSSQWDYDFGGKTNLFPRQMPPRWVNYADIIKQNIVYIYCAHIVAATAQWPRLRDLIDKHFRRLLSFNLVDDDQSLLLMAYYSSPESFRLRLRQDGNGYALFGIFRDHNIYI